MEQMDCRFCTDDELGYLRSRTRFAAGEGLVLDGSYRLAHLPLVAPAHPGVIARRDGDGDGLVGFEMGRHERVFSIAVPVPAEALERSPAYRELNDELKASPFAAKIAWNLLPERRDKLHATICGSLSIGDEPPRLDSRVRAALAGHGPLQVELRGLFSGNVNLGRLYLRAYPEFRNGVNMFRRLQMTLGRRETDLYVVGLHNLVDDLDAAEALFLAGMIERWWDRPILRFRAETLWLLGARDDLVLDSNIAEEIELSR
ncbi:hypothetical protein SAMN05444161_8164 [Rhizobiales bacterium GAS191]|nr:hypothetical protein SAMN05519103_07462 [Rhizobiales bacterium GAS113]SEE96254.1 hypothetical protein SAMN05444161_8164 [Rhizobiales bacterium GAS191]